MRETGRRASNRPETDFGQPAGDAILSLQPTFALIETQSYAYAMAAARTR